MAVKIYYLDLELMEKICHKLAVAIFDKKDDPISPFKEHEISLLESALNAARASFDGVEKYPTLEEKAAVLWYHLNKNHPFKNGNKRISTASMLVFLHLNELWLDSGKNEMVEKSLYIANSDRTERDKVIENLRIWIKDHLTED